MNPFTIDEYEHRWERVYSEMRRRGHEVALVWGKTAGSYERCGDVVYLTNFYSTQSGQEPDSAVWNARSFAAVLLRPGEVPELHMDDVSARRDLVSTDRVHAHFDVVRGVAEALAGHGITGKIAFVGSDFFPLKYMRQLEQATPEIELVIDDDLVRNVRKRKSAQELECYREGGEICTRALNLLMENLIAGKPQTEAAAAAGHAMIKAGATWRRMIMNHGDKLEHLERDPLSGYSADAPFRGDMVRAWVDGIYRGYWLDPGRTAVCGGRPRREQKELVEAVVSVCNALRARIRPGVRVMEIALLGDELVRGSGYGENLVSESWPYYGHGLGCMWEPPLIEKRCCDDEETFEAGMVLGVECFLGTAHLGVAGYEDNFIVTDEGTELITRSPALWW